VLGIRAFLEESTGPDSVIGAIDNSHMG